VRLTIVTPAALVAEVDPVRHVRAEDPTGSFGILPGHADLLTVLVVSVLVYRDEAGRERFVAVRGGVLTVRERRAVEVLTREAVASDDLDQLERDVLVRYRRTAAAEEEAARGLRRLEGALLCRVADHLRITGPRHGVPRLEPR
jgi:F-type H+-transporting ATPase subunit epsilon